MKFICRFLGHRYVSVYDWLRIPIIHYCLRCGRIKRQ